MRIGRGKIVWGYLVEALLTGLICFACWRFADVDAITEFFHKTANSWMVLIGVMLTINGALFVVFVQSLTTDFGGWLKWRGGDRVYKTECVWVLLIDLVAFVGLIVVGYREDGLVSALTIGWLVYAAVNEVTFVKNVMDVVGLNPEFQRTYNQAKTTASPSPPSVADSTKDNSSTKT